MKNTNRRTIVYSVIAVALIALIALGVTTLLPKNTTKTAATTSSSTKQSYSAKDLEGTGQSIPLNNPQPAQPKVLLDITGTGQKQTAPFTTGSDWTVDYTFDCSNFGTQGNMQYSVENVDGTPNSDAGANDLQTSGSANNQYYDAGQHYLKINSECSWHIVVKG